MKFCVLFATLLVIFMSCASNIFAKSSCEDKTDISSQAPSPQLDIQIKNQVLHDKKN
ncbi:BnaA04g15070D [Brassica napus]|uniref:BnaA04g15070D protein n=1 Tax=Brassica napus TaxID=3708 RepID=A0A078HA48_BRANA|nr:BnaA04g15070D [Brassica napus]